MIVKSLAGPEVRIKKVYKYTIDWDKQSRSKFQFNVKQFLKDYWRSDIVFEEFPIPKTRMTVDLFNFTRKIVVEVQGGQHSEYTPHFHGKAHKLNFLYQLKRDEDKARFCEINGFKYVEIYPKDELGPQIFKKQGVSL